MEEEEETKGLVSDKRTESLGTPSQKLQRGWSRILFLAIYLCTGVLQPLTVDFLRYRGAIGAKYLVLPTLCNVVGMFLCCFMEPTSTRNETFTALIDSMKRPRVGSMVAKIGFGSFVDLVSGSLLTFGLMLTGYLSISIINLHLTCKHS